MYLNSCSDLFSFVPQFVGERRTTFQEVTAQVINDYCRQNAESCSFVSRKRDINTRFANRQCMILAAISRQ